MGYRTKLSLTCEFAHEIDDDGVITRECGGDVTHLAAKIIANELFKILLCEGHAKGRYGCEIWDKTATLFSLSNEGYTP